ncbi:MAG: hypothetical protein K2J79_00365, partial [Ruminiclostridium sp.]|nr:hypothetical protein [Ruminiclostridium sp.]
MEKLFDVYVEIIDSVFVKGKLNDVNMLSFTGKVKGKYFNGKVMGIGVDTQYISKDKNRNRISEEEMPPEYSNEKSTHGNQIIINDSDYLLRIN